MKRRIAKKTNKLSEHQMRQLNRKHLEHHCQDCGRYWAKHQNSYFDKWGCCCMACMAHLYDYRSLNDLHGEMEKTIWRSST